MSDGKPPAKSPIMTRLNKLDRSVRRLRSTAAAYEWDCEAISEVAEAICGDEDLCQVLRDHFMELDVAVTTMRETMAVMGSNMMNRLNMIAEHIGKAHTEGKSPTEDPADQSKSIDPVDKLH